jgi:hypothetical protein
MIATTHRYLAVKLERAELTDIGRFDRWNSCRCQCDRARIDNSSRSAPGTRRGGDDRDEVVVDVTLEVGCFFWRVQKWASDRERQGSCSDPCGTVNQFRGSRTTPVGDNRNLFYRPLAIREHLGNAIIGALFSITL